MNAAKELVKFPEFSNEEKCDLRKKAIPNISLPRKNHLEFCQKITWKTWKSPGIPLLQSPNNPVPENCGSFQYVPKIKRTGSSQIYRKVH